MKRSIVLAALLPALVAVQAVHAATVTYRLYRGAFGTGTFKLTAEVTGGSFGLASYGVQLVDDAGEVPGGGILTVNNNSLRAPTVENAALEEGPAGFTTVRSPDMTAASPVHNVYTLGGSQDTPSPTPHLIRGFGQEASSLAAKGLTGAAMEGDPWGNAGMPYLGRPIPPPGEFELARGTYIVKIGSLYEGINFRPIPTGTTFGNVFKTASGISVEAATVVRILLPIPEPSSLALAAFGALGGLAWRRRLANNLRPSL